MYIPWSAFRDLMNSTGAMEEREGWGHGEGGWGPSPPPQACEETPPIYCALRRHLFTGGQSASLQIFKCSQKEWLKEQLFILAEVNSEWNHKTEKTSLESPLSGASKSDSKSILSLLSLPFVIALTVAFVSTLHKTNHLPPS